MATFKKCRNCGQVTEMEKVKNYSGGFEHTYYKCSECGFTEKLSINLVHYGNDEYKK